MRPMSPLFPMALSISIESELGLVFCRAKSSLCRTVLRRLLGDDDDGDSESSPLPGVKETGIPFSTATALP